MKLHINFLYWKLSIFYQLLCLYIVDTDKTILPLACKKLIMPHQENLSYRTYNLLLWQLKNYLPQTRKSPHG